MSTEYIAGDASMTLVHNSTATDLFGHHMRTRGAPSARGAISNAIDRLATFQDASAHTVAQRTALLSMAKVRGLPGHNSRSPA